MAASTSYFDFTKWRAERNPCLQPFVEYLKNGSQDPTRDPTIYSIDYAQSPSTQVEIRRTSLDEVLQHVNPSLLATTAQRLASASPLRRMVLVEDIDVSTIQTLGSRLDIDPLFFAHYIFTELLDIASSPPPPVLVSLPSTFMDKSSIHLHYQQILDLGQADPEAVGTYKFQAQGNVKRSVRCTPSISRTQSAILRGCCSAFLKHLDNGWICLLLVDPSTDLVPKKDSRSSDSSQKDIWQHIPFQGGFEDIVDPIPFSTFTTSSRGLNPIKNSILLNFLRYYEQRPPGLDIDNPNLLSLLYFPIRWVSSNWMLYVMLVNRYYKLYEYRMNQSSVESGLETSLIDLQRWRRRTKQSISKLILITAFIRLHLPSPEEDAKTIFHSHPTTSDLSNLCTILLSDYDHIIYEIKDYRNGIDFLISISTTMFQLRKAQQSVREAINIRRLTYVALFSAPFGLVAAVFSMSANFLPGQPDFWVFMITAMMATSVVAVVALTPGSLVRRACWATMMSARRKVLRAAPSCQRAGASKPAEAC